MLVEFDISTIMDFVFPKALQHPLSTGRLYCFSDYGPLDIDGNLRSGYQRSHILTDKEITTLCEDYEKDDVISIYLHHPTKELSTLSYQEKNDIFNQAEKSLKVTKGRALLPQLTKENLITLIQAIPLTENDTYLFKHIQKLIYHFRLKCIKFFKKMGILRLPLQQLDSLYEYDIDERVKLFGDLISTGKKKSSIKHSIVKDNNGTIVDECNQDTSANIVIDDKNTHENDTTINRDNMISVMTSSNTQSSLIKNDHSHQVNFSPSSSSIKPGIGVSIGGGGIRGTGTIRVSELVAPTSMFIQNEGDNNAEVIEKTTQLLSRHVSSIRPMGGGGGSGSNNSTTSTTSTTTPVSAVDMCANVRLLREQDAYQDTPTLYNPQLSKSAATTTSSSNNNYTTTLKNNNTYTTLKNNMNNDGIIGSSGSSSNSSYKVMKARWNNTYTNTKLLNN